MLLFSTKLVWKWTTFYSSFVNSLKLIMNQLFVDASSLLMIWLITYTQTLMSATEIFQRLILFLQYLLQGKQLSLQMFLTNIKLQEIIHLSIKWECQNPHSSCAVTSKPAIFTQIVFSWNLYIFTEVVTSSQILPGIQMLPLTKISFYLVKGCHNRVWNLLMPMFVM